ncbi:sulfite dehydrogenase [Methylocapsa sp. S129]|uniref:sulfite dehydrogenase n=1 Tax=Methylocapsa sp. S129 TaxID=1641869 RepID=UPI00131B74EF|nr:sulfite dehydrogenase [Methylocapsa sp. S129]
MVRRYTNKSASRREILTGAASLAGAALAASTAEAETPTSNLPPGVPEWQQQPGAEVMSPPYGQPSPFEAGVIRRERTGGSPYPTRQAAVSLTPLQDLHGIITPNGLHYERHHGGVPAIDPAQHRLIIHGLVDRPMIFTMADILRFPATSRLHFLECSGNTQNWGKPDAALTVQDTHGLLSCCEWTGVPLKTVLDAVGVRDEARWMLAEGADSAAMTRSIPIEKAFDDALLAYAQNGERLRPEQGYPLRLLLPGYEGNTSVKWLRRLKLGEAPWQTREETSKYSWIMPDGSVRQFNFVMEAKSVITSPSGGQKLAEPGFHEISGVAWSGHGKVTRVEVSTDGGGAWSDAALQEPVLPKCLTRFRLPWRWPGGPALLSSRATDETGAVQPSREALLKQRDARSYYHYNAIQNWQVAADGAVTNAG